MEKKLRMTREQVLEQAAGCAFARNLCGDIEFSPEDGYRSDMDFLARVVEAVIREGAGTINIPDTVGYGVPELYGEFIKTLRSKVPNSDKAIWSCTATTTWAWRSPTRWPASRSAGRGRSSARSMASVSARATARCWKRS